MDLEKTFLKAFLKNFEEESFIVNLWDGEKVIVGEGEPQFTINIKNPLKKKDLINSTSLAFGEAYMNGNVEFEGDLYTILDVILRHINKFSTKFENVDAVLKESGLFLLHYISGIKESEGDAWIKKYIFPGGVIPTLREIIYISAEYNYHTIDVESLRMHYTFGVEKDINVGIIHNLKEIIYFIQ